MSEWQECNLDEIYEFASGLSKPRSEFGSGYPFLSFKDVFYNYFVPSRLESLVRTDEKERQRCSVRRGDVFLTRTSETMDELGMSCVALHDVPDATFNGFTKRLRPKREDVVLPEYAGYFFRSRDFREDIMSMTTMSTRASLNNEMLGRLKIKIPPASIQSAIGGMLLSLDHKIELNRRMNETLEAMARAIFNDWFVDFGPTRAKAEGREPYLAPELWDLFPDSLDDEGKPAGWSLSEIGKEVEVVGGATPSTKEPAFWEGGEHHWATPKDLSKLESPVLLDTDRKITDSGVRKISSGLLPVGTVLLSSRAPIGYLAIAEVPTAVNQGFIAMVCRKRLPNVFVLFWCYENLDYIKGISGGSTFAEISKKAFRPVPVVVPSEQTLAAYEGLVRPLYDRVAANMKESASLAQTRDLLLPKLMSGEIRLRDAEQVVEAVA